MPEEKEKKSSKWFFLIKEQFSHWDSYGIRLIIGIFVTLILALFLHFRQVDVAVLELDSTAKKTHVAPTDFAFYDEKATQKEQQEAIRGLSRIYEILPQQIDTARMDFEKKLLFDSAIDREQMQKLYDAAQKLSIALVNTRFTSRMTVEQIKKFVTDKTFFYPFAPGKEESEKLPKKLYNQFIQTLNLDEQLSETLMHYYQNVKWKFVQDPEKENIIQSMISSSIPQKQTKMSAGSRIIRKGEKVTPRHIAMMQGIKTAMQNDRNLWQPSTMLGSVILASLFVIISVIYFRLKHPGLLENTKKLLLYVSIVLLALVIAKTTELLLLEHRSRLIDVIHYPLFIPFATILLCFLMGVEIALFTTVLLSVIFAITLQIDESKFLVINLVASLVCLFNTRFVRKRTEIFSICARAWLSCIVVVMGFILLKGVWWDISVYHDLISTLIFMILTAILCIGLLPFLESIFQIMTNVTLMEYLDPNNSLLRRLSIEAPGTHQHSLLTANLAEAAALSIGANGVFCRVATMYHDIGKLFNPQYFTENQQAGFNMHSLLTPEESAEVIIEHVKSGETLARKYKLPKIFINIIREHHGTTLVYFFYHKMIEKLGSEYKVDQQKFRYPGPKPKTKESAIIMIADSIEAASHSLNDFNQSSVTSLVEELVQQKAEDNQFDNCPITFEELSQIKSSLVKSLVKVKHVRPKYPHEEGEEKPAPEDA